MQIMQMQVDNQDDFVSNGFKFNDSSATVILVAYIFIWHFAEASFGRK